jgi:DNA-binding GntR family transcriptional regulator
VDEYLPTKPASKDKVAPKVSAAASSEEDAAKDLIAAVQAGDAKAASLALKRHYEACYEDKDDDEEA